MIEAAARRSTGDSALSGLLREQQDMVGRARDFEAAMIAALSAGDVAAAATQRSAHAEAMQRLSMLEQQLDKTFPAYRSFASPQGLSIAAAQSQLGDGEALLVAALNDFDVHSFLVTKNGSWWVGTDVAQDMLGWIARLRCDVDIQSCPHKLVVERRKDIFATASDGPRFDFASANKIYATIFEPFEPQLRKVRRLYVVTSPALRDFSMAMLVPRKEDVRRGRLATTRWLGDRFALTYLPSVASLALDRGQRPFMHDRTGGLRRPRADGQR